MLRSGKRHCSKESQQEKDLALQWALHQLSDMNKQKNYIASNKIHAIHVRVPRAVREIAYSLLFSSHKTTDFRQQKSQGLLDALTDLCEIDVVNVKISDAKQWHKKYKGRVQFKQYGYYKPGTKYIYINNRTAVRGQLLASKTFIDTLLHEWVHHYDHCRLKLDSIHTTGFYNRLTDIKQKVGYFRD
jgi:hypothetical protein